MKKLEIIGLSVATNDGKEILRDVSMRFEIDKKYVILGPNGSGKSTLISAIMGHPHYQITSGKILLDGRDITNSSTDEKAKLGLFLGFQYPMEIEGVSFSSFLRTILSNRNEKTNFYETLKNLPKWTKDLGFKNFNSTRDLNVGFSGGEKKRSEIIQMLALKPKFAFLDEPDSGLDVDGLNALTDKLTKLDFPVSLIVVTHRNEALNSLKPDIIYVMKNGKLVANGDMNLAKKINEKGFKDF